MIKIFDQYQYEKNLQKELHLFDNEISKVYKNPFDRYFNMLNLVASESLPLPIISSFLASYWQNQTIEGYLDKRYFPKTQVCDSIEKIGIKRAKEIFNYEYINIQPHSASQANQAVLLGLLKPGDRILSMSLESGGHISHGNIKSFASKIFEIRNYSVDSNSGLIDYDDLKRKAEDYKPKLIISGASSYPREIDFQKIWDISRNINAIHFADIAHPAGLIATGLLKSPSNFSHIASLSFQKTLCGPRGGMILADKKFSKFISEGLFPGLQSSIFPSHIIAKTLCLGQINKPYYIELQNKIKTNAISLSEALKDRNWRVITGGTDTHLVLTAPPDSRMTGKKAEYLLSEGGILANRNYLFYDKKSGTYPSGIRFGTTVVSILGLESSDMYKIADLMTYILEGTNSILSKNLKLELLEKIQLKSDRKNGYVSY